jgi:hypothetical protein
MAPPWSDNDDLEHCVWVHLREGATQALQEMLALAFSTGLVLGVVLGVGGMLVGLWWGR